MPVYIIRAGDTDMVKIGWADDPEQRRAYLQTAHYNDLRIIRLIEGPPQLEGWLHCHFNAHWVRGEWYRLDPAMLTVDIGDVQPSLSLAVPCNSNADCTAPLKRALIASGGPSKLAKQLGVVPSAVTQWTRIPARHVWRIEHITGIPGRELRPDLYPAEAAA